MATTPWWTNWNLNYTPDGFGRIYGGGSVQEAFYNTLQEWFPTYVALFNRQLGGEILKDVKEWRFRPDFSTDPRDYQPRILVSVPHTVGTPQRYQDGWRAQWRVDVMVYVFGTQDWQETQALTYAYATMMRALILQHPDLGGFAQTTMWESDEYLEGDHSSTRTRGIAHVQFIVTIGNVIDQNAGPPSINAAPAGAVTGPTTSPLPLQPDVASVDITISKE